MLTSICICHSWWLFHFPFSSAARPTDSVGMIQTRLSRANIKKSPKARNYSLKLDNEGGKPFPRDTNPWRDFQSVNSYWHLLAMSRGPSSRPSMPIPIQKWKKGCKMNQVNNGGTCSTHMASILIIQRSILFYSIIARKKTFSKIRLIPKQLSHIK